MPKTLYEDDIYLMVVRLGFGERQQTWFVEVPRHADASELLRAEARANGQAKHWALIQGNGRLAEITIDWSVENGRVLIVECRPLDKEQYRAAYFKQVLPTYLDTYTYCASFHAEVAAQACGDAVRREWRNNAPAVALAPVDEAELFPLHFSHSHDWGQDSECRETFQGLVSQHGGRVWPGYIGKMREEL